MPAILARDWRRALLRAIVEQGVIVHLYVNDYSPDPTTSLADLEEMPEKGGYHPVGIPSSAWAMADALPIARYDAGVRFAFTEAVGMVYGYFLTTRNGEYIGAERADRFPLDIHAFDGIEIIPQFAI